MGQAKQVGDRYELGNAEKMLYLKVFLEF